MTRWQRALARPPAEALATLGLFTLLLLIYFSPLLLGRTFLTASSTSGTLPSGPYGIERPTPRQVVDPGASAWVEEPWTYVAGQLVRSGQLPLWDPYHGLGTPLLAHMVAAPFYPLKLWAYVLPFEVGWDFYVFSQLLLAAMLTYAFARTLALSPPAAFLAGTAFVLSGPVVLDFNHFLLGAYTFMPGQFLGLERYARSGRARWLALASLATAAGFSAGNPQPSILATASASIYYLVTAVAYAIMARQSLARGALRALRSLVLFGLLSGLLSAVVLVPFLETTALGILSHQAGLGERSLPWNTWALPLALPELFGDSFLRSVGLGSVALSLAVVGALSPPSGMRSRYWCLAALTAAWSGKMFGFPGLQWLGALPLLDRLLFDRYLPAAVAFLVAILAGAGVQRLRGGRTPWLVLCLSVCLVLLYWLAAVLPLLAIRQLLSMQAAAALLAVFAAFGAPLAARRYWPHLLPAASALPVLLVFVWSDATLAPKALPPRRFPYAEPPFVEWIRSQGDSVQRVLSLDGVLSYGVSSAFGLPNLSLTTATPSHRLLGLALHLEPGFTTAADTFRIPNSETRLHPTPIWDRPVLDLLGIRYLIVASRLPEPVTSGRLLRVGRAAVAAGACATADAASYEIDGVWRPVVWFAPPCVVRLPLWVPPDSRVLEFSLGVDPAVWAAETGDGVIVRLWIEHRDGERLVVDELLDPRANPRDRRWSSHSAPVEGVQGQGVVLRLEVDPGPLGDRSFDRVGLADLALGRESGVDAAPGSRWRLAYDGEVRIYTNTGALPRAFLVEGARLVDSAEDALDVVVRSDFDARRHVVFDREGPRPVSASLLVASGAGPLPDPLITLHEAGRVRLTATAPRDAYLVLSDLYYPGWRATVDGMPTPLYQGDYLLRVVRLPAGDHEVEFLYDPLTFRLGLTLTLGTLVVLVVLALVRRSPT